MQTTYWTEALVSGLIAGLLLVVPIWRVYSRAGLNPLWSLLVFIPGLGLLLTLLILAVRPWPAAGETARR